MKPKQARDIHEAGFDKRLVRSTIDNAAIDVARFATSDLEFLRELQATIDSVGVNSVNNQNGDVVLTTDNIAEGGTNLYYTDARVTQSTKNITIDVNSDYVVDETLAGGVIHLVVDASGGNITIDLPAATDIEDRGLDITKVDSSGYKIIVDPDGSETINGQTTKTILFQWSTLSIRSDGFNWYII